MYQPGLISLFLIVTFGAAGYSQQKPTMSERLYGGTVALSVQAMADGAAGVIHLRP